MGTTFFSKFNICGNTATPKYVLSQWLGKYPPLRYLVGKDGKISFYLQTPISESSGAPQYRLQGKSSINITGLWPCGNNVYFGQPPRGQRYSAKQKVNPFAGHEMDGFLFIFAPDMTSFEMLVFSGQRLNIGQIAQDVANGCYQREIKELEQRAAQHFANV